MSKESTNELPLMIRLANLLHEHRDENAEPVRAFIQEHSADPGFVRRANTMLKLFRLNSPPPRPPETTVT